MHDGHSCPNSSAKRVGVHGVDLLVTVDSSEVTIGERRQSMNKSHHSIGDCRDIVMGIL